jgi:hypothetical protein
MQLWTSPRVRLSLKESRMKFANATNLDRKSGFDSAPVGRSLISLFGFLVMHSAEIFHQVENKQCEVCAMSQ